MLHIIIKSIRIVSELYFFLNHYFLFIKIVLNLIIFHHDFEIITCEFSNQIREIKIYLKLFKIIL